MPACKDCNTSILRDLPIFTEDERAYYVLNVLRDKLLILGEPGWTDEEIEELGPNLRSEILSGLHAYDSLLRRVNYAMRVHERATEIDSDSLGDLISADQENQRYARQGATVKPQGHKRRFG